MYAHQLKKFHRLSKRYGGLELVFRIDLHHCSAPLEVMFFKVVWAAVYVLPPYSIRVRAEMLETAANSSWCTVRR